MLTVYRETLTQYIIHLKEGGESSLYLVLFSLATVTSCIDPSVRIVTKSPKVELLLYFFHLSWYKYLSYLVAGFWTNHRRLQGRYMSSTILLTIHRMKYIEYCPCGLYSAYAALWSFRRILRGRERGGKAPLLRVVWARVRYGIHCKA
jgi:hypothetical protein